jgi:hypothetical protein
MSALKRLSLPVRVSLALLVFAAIGSSANAQARGAAAQPASPLRIFFAESPALLIRIEGDPVYEHIEGTDLARIVNTRALIVRDPAGIHYLKVLDGWMEAYMLRGEWSVSGVTPPGGAQALERAVRAGNVDLLTGRGSEGEPRSLAEQAPVIFTALKPAALVVTDGTPRYESVDGTSLERLVNTTGTVFREPTDQQLYVLVSGQWYRSWTTDGAWQLIPSDELPADIARYARRLPGGER